MLKKGQVYKITYELNTEDSKYLKRDNMIISPAYDVSVQEIHYKKVDVNVMCLFHINLGNIVNRNIKIGTSSVKKIEKPSTQEDFDDIAKAMEICGLTYNKQWNRIEGYEGMNKGISFNKTIK